MPVSISVNVCRCCGCKSTTFIYIYKGFYYIISIFFISRWYNGFYNTKFFWALLDFDSFCLFGVVFATKAPEHKVWFSLFIGLYWLFKKSQSSSIFLFSSWKREISSANSSLSPDRSGNPFAFFFKKQKIGTNSGK
jgi:hypothetical protein